MTDPARLMAEDDRLVPVDHGMGSMGVKCRLCEADDYFHHGQVEHTPECAEAARALSRELS